MIEASMKLNAIRKFLAFSKKVEVKMTTVAISSPVRPDTLNTVKRIGTGLAFILFPLIFIFAYAVHPGLLSPHILSDLEVIMRAHHNPLLQFGHALDLLDAAFLIVVALEFKRLLEGTPAAWNGLIGSAAAVLGAIMLAAEKGAECLTMSALDTLSEQQFAQSLPALVAIFSKQGLMVLVWGVLLIAVGFVILAIGLLRTNIIPRWQSALLLIGICFLGGPDGVEIINLGAAIVLAIALVPYGVRSIMKKDTYNI
jgi:hypothetical protein